MAAEDESKCYNEVPEGWRCTRGFHVDGPCALVPPLGQAIHNAIGEALQAEDGSIPSRWVLVCESLEKDGSTRVWDACNEGLSGWESLGMFAYGSQIIQARVLVAEMRDNGVIE